MATQIGPKIGVDGEAEYRKQMANIVQEAKTLKAEMSELKTAVTDESTAQENATKQAELLNKQIDNQEKRIELLTEKVKTSAAETGESSTQTLKYREQLANAQTVLNAMRKEQQGATDDVEEFADAEDEAGQNAVTMGDLLKANVLSEVILSGLKKLAELGKKAAQALWGTVTGAATYADTYLTMSTVTGLSTDQLQEFAYMSELVDVSLDTMTGGMTKLTKQMTAARKGNETAADAFKRLGIQTTNADGTLRDATEVFFEVIDALGQMEAGSERDALAMDLFGKSAQELNPMIAQGSKGLQAFAEEAREMGYVLDEETLGKLGEVDDGFQRLNNLRTTISNRLGAGMAPGVTKALDKLLEFGERVDWERVGDKLGTLVDTGVDKLIEFADTVDLDKLADGALKLGEGIVTGGTWILEHADEIIKLLGTLGGGLLLGKGIKTTKNAIDTVTGLFGLGKGAGGAAAAGEAAAAAGPAAGEALGAAAGPAFWETLLAASPLAAVLGGVVIGAKQGTDYVNFGKARGTIEDGSIEKYRALLEDLQADLEKTQTEYDNLALWDDGSTLGAKQLEIDNLKIAIAEAEKNLAELEANAAALEGEGENAMASYANGITAGADKWLAPALRGAAALVSAYFHHSEPDVGPMANDADWMPDMMQGWARQIEDNSYLVRNAMAGLAYDLRDTMRPGAMGGSSVNYGGVNVTFQVQDGQDGRALFEEFSYWLENEMAKEGAVFAQ